MHSSLITSKIEPERIATPADGVLPEESAQLLLRRTLELHRQNFARSEAARSWLESHGMTNLSLLDRHHIGWSDGKLPVILPDDPALRADLTTLGVLTAEGREYFTECVVFPIYSHDGQIASLVGLTATGAEKPLPHRPLPLWNLAAAKLSSTLLLAPTIMDALALMAAGNTNVIALSPELGAFDGKILKTWGVQRLTIVHGDTPESLAEIKSLQTRLGDYTADVITLRGTRSARTMLVAHGARFLGEAIVSGTHGVSTLNIPGMRPLPGGFTLTIGSRRYDVRGLQAASTRMKATVRSEHAGKIHVDTLDLFVARARRQLIIDLVRLHEESADAIEADVTKLLAACELRSAQPDLTANQDAADPIPEADRREAEAMGKDPSLIETILEDYERCGLVGERTNKLLSYLVMTSRKMSRPLALLNLSSSGTGKSALQDATHAFCPPEDAIKTTNLSAKALFHRDRYSLKNKFLVLEEGTGIESAAYALRVLISSGELTTEVATKDPASGRLVSMRNHVEGPVAVSFTTTSPDTDPETRSRFFLISTDESVGQTEAILEYQRRQHTLDGLKDLNDRKSVHRRHHAFQRMLQPLHVVNPLAQRMHGMSNRLTARRDQPKLLGLVNAVAFLRQMTKEVKRYQSSPYIEVDEADLRIASGLLDVLTGPGRQEVSQPARELLQVLVRMRQRIYAPEGRESGDFSFTRRQVREFAHWERTRVHRYLAELIDLEYVLRTRSRRGMTDSYALAWEGEKTFGESESILPSDSLRPPLRAANG